MHKVSIADILQTMLILIFIAVPPWLTLIKYFKHKINKIIMILFFICYIITTYFTQNIFAFIIVITIIFIIYHYKSNEEEIYYLRALKDKKNRVLGLTIGFKIFITIINAWFATFLSGFGVKLEQQDFLKVFMVSSWAKIILLSIMAVIIAPVLEEFVFRHTLYRQLSKRVGKIWACLITSGLFALLHFNALGTISFFGVGIFSCYLYDKYGYRASVLNHFVFNFVSTFMIIMAKIFHQI
jgi:uncharacterized protein